MGAYKYMQELWRKKQSDVMRLFLPAVGKGVMEANAQGIIRKALLELHCYVCKATTS